MKKCTETIKSTIIFILILIFIAFVGYAMHQRQPKITTEKATVQETVQKKVISQQNNAKIIGTELRKTGKLIILQGKENYQDTYEDAATWLGIEWTYKEIYLDLTFNFALSYDLNNLHIYTLDNTVHINVDPQKLYIEYVELDNKQSVMSSYASMFAEKVTAEEISAHLELAQERTLEKIQVNEEYFNKACESLDEQLRNIVEQLGYQDILIDFGGEE